MRRIFLPLLIALCMLVGAGVDLRAAIPTVQAKSLYFTGVGQNQMTVKWTKGNGSRRLVLAKEAANIDLTDLNGEDYAPEFPAANANFTAAGLLKDADGDDIEGTKVVYDGTGNSATVTGLTAGTTYYFMVIEYNADGANWDIKTATATSNPRDKATMAEVLTLGAGAASNKAFKFSWNSVDAVSWYEVSVATDAAFADIVDEIDMADIGTSTEYVCDASALSAGTTYYYRARYYKAGAYSAWATGSIALDANTPHTFAAANRAYTEGAAVVVDAAAALADANNEPTFSEEQFKSVTVQIVANDGPGDALDCDVTGMSATKDFVDGTNTLTITRTGQYIPFSELEAILRSVTYVSGDNPGSGTRTLTWSVTDINNVTVTDNSDITVTPVNDAPTMTTMTAAVDAVNEDTEVEITYAEIAAQANESDPEGDVLRFKLKALSSGTLKATSGGADVNVDDLLASGQSWFWTPAANANGALPAFEFVAMDAALESTPNVTATVTVNAINDAPTYNAIASHTATVGEDGANATFTIANIDEGGGADEDNQVITVTTLSCDNETLVPLGNIGIVYAADAAGANDATGDATITINPANDQFGDAVIVVRISDGTNNADETFTVHVAPVNDLPTLTSAHSGDETKVSFTENGVAINVLNDITVFDVDNANMSSATISIATGFAGAEDVLDATLAGSVTKSYNAATGVLTLSTVDAIANFQTVLNSVTYVNTSDNPSTADRVITFVINDGFGNSASISETVSVTATNDAPVFTAVADFTTNEDVVLAIPYANLLANSNVTDAENDAISFELVAKTGANGELYSDAGCTAPVDAGARLATGGTWYWKPTANANGANTNAFTVKAWDGTALSADPVQVSVDVAVVNDAPVLTANAGPFTFTEGGAAVDNDIVASVTDVDDANMNGAVITLTNVQAGDVIDVTPVGGIAKAVVGGVITLSNAASIADYVTTLNSLTFTNGSEDPNTTARTFTVTLTDVNNSVGSNGVQTSNVGSFTINVVPVNDAPLVALNTTAFGYTENDGAVTINTDCGITDADDANMNGAVITLSNYIGAEDVIAVTIPEGSTIAADGVADGVITLSGEASIADYEGVINSLTYTNTSNNPTAGARNFTLTVTDANSDGVGAQTSDAETFAVTVSAANDAPVLASLINGSALAYTEQEAAKTVLSDVTLTDPDNDAGFTATVEITAGGHANDVLAVPAGVLAANGDGTATFATPTLTISARTKAQMQAVLQAVTFENANDNPTDGDRTITFTVTDAGVGNLTGTITRTIDFTKTNDAPTWTSVNDFNATEDVEAEMTYADLQAMAQGEADLELATINFRITAVNTGTLYTVAAGPVYTPAVLPLVVADGTTIAWKSAANANGQDIDAFTMAAYDGEMSSNAIVVKADVSEVNDAPTAITGVPANYNEEQANGSVIATLGATDVDAGQTYAYAINGGADAAYVTIVGNELQVASRMNYEDAAFADHAINVIIRVTDTGLNPVNTTYDQTFSIALNDINDAPTLASIGADLSATQETPYELSFEALSNAAVGTLDNVGGDGVNTSDYLDEDVADHPDYDQVNFKIKSISADWTVAIGPDADNLTPVAVDYVFDKDAGRLWITPPDGLAGADKVGLTVVAFDGELESSTPIDVRFDIVDLNDAPEWVADDATRNNFTAITEDQTPINGNTTDYLINTGIYDPDLSGIKGIAITAISPLPAAGNGTWYYSTNGTDWIVFPVVTENNALHLLKNATNKLRFVPTANYYKCDAEIISITAYAWDQSNMKANGYKGAILPAEFRGGNSPYSVDSKNFTIDVTPVNDAPVLAAAYNEGVAASDEDVTPGGFLISNWLTAGAITDPSDDNVCSQRPGLPAMGGDPDMNLEGIAITSVDNANGAWQYLSAPDTWTAIAGVDGTHALLLQDDDMIRFVPNANWNGTASISYRAWDRTSGARYAKVDPTGNTAFSTNEATTNYTVDPVNDVPTLDAIAALNINEDAALQTVALAGIGSGMANEAQTLTVTVTSSNEALIPTPTVNYISANATGNITFTPVANGNGSSTITVRVTDDENAGGDAFFVEQSFLVTVAPVNDQPYFDNLDDERTFTEISGAPPAPLRPIAVDQKAFYQGLNGWIYDGAAGDNYAHLTDVDGNSLPAGASIEVTYAQGMEANDNLTLFSDNSINIVGSTLTWNWDYTATIDDVKNGVNGAPLLLTFTGDNWTIDAARSVVHRLAYYNHSNDFDPAKLVKRFNIVFNDGSGAGNAASAPATTQITVTPINDAPTLDALATLNLNEDAGAQSVDLAGITTGGEAGQTLTVTATSDNTDLIPNPVVTYNSPDATGSIAFTPVAGASGTATITVTVTDDGSNVDPNVNSVSRTFAVNVAPVNDPPTIDAINNLIIAEDAATQGVSINGITNGGEAGQTINIVATSSNTDIIPNPTVIYTSPNATGILALAPVANAHGGPVTITVTVTDDGSNEAPNDNVTIETFDVTVNSVNDLPVLTTVSNFTTGEDVPVTITYADLLSKSNASDVDGDAISFELIAKDANGELYSNAGLTDVVANGTRLAAAGTWYWKPEANLNGLATNAFTLRAWDGTANSALPAVQVKFDISEENDAPTAVNTVPDAPAGIDENSIAGAMSLGLSTADAEGDQSYTYEILAGGNADLFTLREDNGTTYLENKAGLDYETIEIGDHTLSVTVRSTDNGTTGGNPDFKSVNRTFTFDLTDLNEAPVMANELATELAWTTDNGALAIQPNLTFSDEDAGATVSKIEATFQSGYQAGQDVLAANDNAEMFTITPDLNGKITITAAGAPNYTDWMNVAKSITYNNVSETPTETPRVVRIEAFDDDNLTDFVDRTITIDDLNESPVLATGAASAVTFTENGAAQAILPNITVTDAEDNIIKAEVWISANREATDVLAINDANFTATGAGSAADKFVITANDAANETPAAFQAMLRGLTFASSSDNPSTAERTISFQVTDGGTPPHDSVSNVVTNTATVTAVNDAPTGLALSADNFNENIADASVAANLSASDVEGNTLTYTLVAGDGDTDNGLFTIAGNTLKITTSPNYEAQGSYSVRIRATDNGTPNENVESAFTLTVNDLNEAPTAIVLSANTIEENNDANAVIGGLTVTDPDNEDGLGIQTHTYAIGGADAAYFNISGNDLRMTNPMNFEAAHGPVYNITITATDNDASPLSSAAIAFTVNVTNENEAPTLTSIDALAGTEDATLAIAYDDLVAAAHDFADVDAGTTLRFICVGKQDGTLSANVGNTLSSGGVWNWTPDADVNGAKNAFTVRAYDDDLQSGADIQVVVNLAPVNDAPVLAAGDYILPDIEEDNIDSEGILISALLGGNVSDVDADAVEGIAITGFDAAEGQWQYKLGANGFEPINEEMMEGGEAFHISAAAGNAIRFVPTTDQNGTLSFTFRAWDATNGVNDGEFVAIGGNGGTTAYSAFLGTGLITITEVNDIPTAMASLSTTVNEDAGASTATITDVTEGAENESAQTLTFTILSNDNPTLFNGDVTVDGYDAGASTATVNFTPADNANGVAHLVVRITDDGMTASAPDPLFVDVPVTITVSELNDAPTIAAIDDQAAIDEDSGDHTVALSGLTEGPANESAQTLNVTATSSNPLIVPNPTVVFDEALGTGTLTYAPAANANGGPVTITVTVTDSGLNGGDNQNVTTETFTVTVNPVNDAPTAMFLPANPYVENSGNLTLASLSTTDVDGPGATYTITAGGEYFELVNGNELTLLDNVSYEDAHSLDVTIQVADGGTPNLTFDSTFTIYITDVNEAPTAIELTNNEIDENNAANAVIGTLNVTEPDNADGEPLQTHTYVIGGADAAYFNISGNSLRMTDPMNYEDAHGPAYTITLTATDDGTPNLSTAPVEFTINVTNVLETPTLTTISALAGTEDTPLTITYEALKAASDIADEEDVNPLFNVEAIIGGGELTKDGAPVATNTTLGAGESFVFTPTLNSNGLVSVFSVKAKDSDGLLSTTAIPVAINIAAVNDDPTLAAIDEPAAILEDAGEQTITLTGISEGPANESAQTLTFSVATSEPGLITAPEVVFVDGATEATLTYTPVENANGATTVTVTVEDNLGASVEQQFTVNVTAVNDAPDWTNPTDLAMNEGATTMVSLTNVITGPANESSQAIGERTVTSDNAKLTANIEGDEITLMVNEDMTENATATVTVTLTDDGGADNGGINFATKTFTVTLNEVNDVPTLTAISALAGTEDTPLTITYDALKAASDIADEEDVNPTFNVETVIGGGTLTKGEVAVEANTTLGFGESFVYTPALNSNGARNIFTVKAKDSDDALSTTDAVAVNVNVAAVNDAPTLTTIDTFMNALQNVTYEITYDELLAAADEADVDGDALGFVFTGNLEAGSGLQIDKGEGRVDAVANTAILDSGDTFYWTPALDEGGIIDAFTVQATDGITASGSDVIVKINIEHVNTVPTDIALSSTSLNENVEDGYQVATLTSVDADHGDMFTYSLVEGEGDENNSKFAIEGDKLVVNGDNQINFEEFSALNVRIRTTDQGALYTEKAFTLTVIDQNDVPTLAANATMEGATEDQDFTITYDALKSALNANDEDATDALTFEVQSVTDGSTLSAMTLAEGESIVWNAAENANGDLAAFTVKVSDGTATSGEAQVTVAVAAVNDAPLAYDLEPAALTFDWDTQRTTGVTISNELELGDVDGVSITSATVKLTGGFNAGDVLNYATLNGINGSWNNATKTLTLTEQGTFAAYVQAIRSVVFNTTENRAETIGLEVKVYDGELWSEAATRALTLVEGLANEPTTQVSNLTASNTRSAKTVLGWTAGNGSKRIVVAREGAAVNFTPADRTLYNAQNSTTMNLASGESVGDGNTIVFNGSSASPLTLTGLNPNSTYYFTAFEYNDVAGAVNFLTTAPATTTTTTSKAPTQLYIAPLAGGNVISSGTTFNLNVQLRDEDGHPAYPTTNQTFALTLSGAKNDLTLGSPTSVMFTMDETDKTMTALNYAAKYGDANVVLTLDDVNDNIAASTYDLDIRAAKPTSTEVGTALSFQPVAGNNLNVKWTVNNTTEGVRYLLVAKNGTSDGSPTFVPQDGTNYPADTNYATASVIVDNYRAIFNGARNTSVWQKVTTIPMNTYFRWKLFTYYGDTEDATTFSYNTANAPAVLNRTDGLKAGVESGIELASLAATSSDRKVKLSWETNREPNNLGFELYRSNDNDYENFELVGSFSSNSSLASTGANGGAYKFVDADAKLQTGKTYIYKLAAVLGDGTKDELGLVDATVLDGASAEAGLFVAEISPNPVVDKVTTYFTLASDRNVRVELLDMTGKLVMTPIEGKLSKAGERNEISFTMPRQAASGQYILSITAGDEGVVAPFMFVK